MTRILPTLLGSVLDKLLGCFYDYRFPPKMQKAFDGSDRFFPINYKTSWAIVRDVAKGSGGGGLVGTGGIGMALDSALNLFQWNRVATILLAIFAIVILAEVAVTFVRKRIL